MFKHKSNLFILNREVIESLIVITESNIFFQILLSILKLRPDWSAERLMTTCTQNHQEQIFTE